MTLNAARRPGTPVRPVTVLLFALMALASLGVAIVLYRAYGDSPGLRYGVRGYTVASDRSVEVVFEVDAAASTTALCTVRARDRAGSEVGNSLVRVGPAPDRRRIVTYDLVTSGRASSGEVTACVLEGPP